MAFSWLTARPFRDSLSVSMVFSFAALGAQALATALARAGQLARLLVGLAPHRSPRRPPSGEASPPRLRTTLPPANSGLVALHFLDTYRGPHSSAAPCPLQRSLLRFKYHGDRCAGRALSRDFARAFDRGRLCEAVLAVPMHPRRLRHRGFNQAAWLARAVSRRTGMPLRSHLLVRTQEAPPQAGLRSRGERAGVRGAFRVRELRRVPSSVLIVDDVCTTGTTLAACAEALHAAGVIEVRAAVLLLVPRARPPL